MRLIVRRCKVSSWLLLLLLLLLPALLLQSKLPGGSWINSSSTCCRSSSATGYGQDPAGWLAGNLLLFSTEWLTKWLFALFGCGEMDGRGGRKAAEGRTRREEAWEEVSAGGVGWCALWFSGTICSEIFIALITIKLVLVLFLGCCWWWCFFFWTIQWSSSSNTIHVSRTRKKKWKIPLKS